MTALSYLDTCRSAWLPMNLIQAQREFISRIPIPPLHAYRIRGEEKADAAPHDYERELQTVFPLFAGRCDLILLGFGEDGHTASLFPEMEALREAQHKVRAVFEPRLGSWHVTLTLPVIAKKTAHRLILRRRQLSC